MKYLVCKKQHGDGCDYTIGCGMRYDFVEANSIEEVTESEIYPDGRDEWCALDGESALSEILIIPVDNITRVDIDELVKVRKQEVEEEKQLAIEAAEKAELARLSKKYGA